jgi:hypothetical protein
MFARVQDKLARPSACRIRETAGNMGPLFEWGDSGSGPNFLSRRRDVELTFSLTLPDALFQELIVAAKDCKCSPKQFVTECLECVLASRRLPRVGRHGPRIGTADAGGDLENSL